VSFQTKGSQPWGNRFFESTTTVEECSTLLAADSTASFVHFWDIALMSSLLQRTEFHGRVTWLTSRDTCWRMTGGSSCAMTLFASSLRCIGSLRTSFNTGGKIVYWEVNHLLNTMNQVIASLLSKFVIIVIIVIHRDHPATSMSFYEWNNFQLVSFRHPWTIV